MYESFNRLIGRRVCGEDCKCFGRLSDIIVNKGTNEIIGIVSKSDFLPDKGRLFLKSDIFGLDALRIYVRGCGIKYKKNPSNFQSVGNEIYKRAALEEDGSVVGKIQNINLSFEAGEIIGFEVGRSIAQDLLEGRKIRKAQSTIKVCQKGVILNSTDR